MTRWKLLFFITVIFSTSVFSQEDAANPFNFKWDNGFKLESRDSIFSLKFGGSLIIDYGYFQQDTELTDKFGPLVSKSGTEIRRARLFFSGDIYHNTYFKFQVDFAGDEVSLKDAFIGISDIPVIGNIQLGHFKEPFRLSVLTSDKYVTFMERGPNSYFTQSRNNGAMVLNDFLDKQLSFQMGAFRNANNNSNDALANDGYVLTGRVTGIPIRDNATKQLLHIGAAYSFRKPDSKEYKVSVKPNSNLAEKYLTTGTIEFVNDISLANFETAYIYGPFSIQAEYLTASVNAVDYQYNFSSYYGELSYFITGESRNYRSSYDGFGRIKPKNNFGGAQKGPGALELALRYSKTDLGDELFIVEAQSEFALGINWYLNPVTRLMLNYTRTDIENKGNLDGIQARFQIDF